MQISSLLANQSGELISANAQDTVREATATLSEKRIGALPVVEGKLLHGIFSERDVIYGLAAEGASFLDKKLQDVMTRELVTVKPETNVLTALSMMTRRRIRHLPVIDNGSIVGLVSIGDLVKSRIDEIESEAEAMREYIQQV